jgi:hypothetical protein
VGVWKPDQEPQPCDPAYRQLPAREDSEHRPRTAARIVLLPPSLPLAAPQRRRLPRPLVNTRRSSRDQTRAARARPHHHQDGAPTAIGRNRRRWRFRGAEPGPLSGCRLSGWRERRGSCLEYKTEKGILAEILSPPKETFYLRSQCIYRRQCSALLFVTLEAAISPIFYLLLSMSPFCSPYRAGLQVMLRAAKHVG